MVTSDPVKFCGAIASAQSYDIVIKGGHVIDPKNNIDAVMDVAISNGKLYNRLRILIPNRPLRS